ncbi:GNAT family N-acetyltransferase [Micromonospora sp. NPDC003197]
MAHSLIRRAHESDAPALAQLRREWTEEEQGSCDDPEFERRFAAWYASESTRRITWLAELDGRPVGMVNMAVFDRMPRPGCEPSQWGYLGNAFVLKAYRSQGIGQLLIAALLEYANRNDFARVVLSPTERSAPFYERAGFGPADVLMVKTFGASDSPGTPSGDQRGRSSGRTGSQAASQVPDR